MNHPELKPVALSINPALGIIYGVISLAILLIMLLAPRQMVFGSAPPTPSGIQLKPQPAWLPEPLASNLLSCAFKKITGLPCLTCGGTRSSYFLARLNFRQSFLMNHLVFLLFITGLLYGALCTGIFFLMPERKRAGSIRGGWKRILSILLIGMVLINWAYLIFILRP